MNRVHIAILAPALSGVALVPLVFVNLSQFHSGSIEVGSMLGRELPVVMFGLVSSLALFVMAIVWLFKKQWLKSLGSAISILVFFVCFIVAGSIGGVFLNAT
ncbi:hypothetical protein [Gilvimarinus polysaccharolyticus]|uniref:hypothetical protein n=1 Tax=Gilvimarinus polysaccharolyticus TaxID=863921 RepID=UPI00067360F3|nr:hypothetical protein [Gilvimarinus polysaccharolyticus]